MESLGYLVTVTGLMNGLNPCALGLMVTFLGYLVVFGGKKKDRSMLTLGGLYLFGVVVTYLLLGLVFYNLAYGLQRSVWVGATKYVLAGIIFVFGLMQIFGKKIEMPKVLSGWSGKLMKKINGPVAVAVGGLMAVVSAPCTLPVYVGTAMVLSRSGVALVKVLFYFLYYNVLFVLPLVVVLFLIYKGKEVMEMKEWGHRNERWLRVAGGVLLLFLSWWMIR